jgi:amidophosphoribosyltransferase
MNVEDMRQFLGATSLSFLSYEGMVEATGMPESDLCTSCFNGKYPIDLHERAKEVTLLSTPSPYFAGTGVHNGK